MCVCVCLLIDNKVIPIDVYCIRLRLARDLTSYRRRTREASSDLVEERAPRNGNTGVRKPSHERQRGSENKWERGRRDIEAMRQPWRGREASARWTGIRDEPRWYHAFTRVRLRLHVRFVIPDLLSHEGLEPFNFDRVCWVDSRGGGSDDGFMMDGIAVYVVREQERTEDSNPRSRWGQSIKKKNSGVVSNTYIIWRVSVYMCACARIIPYIRRLKGCAREKTYHYAIRYTWWHHNMANVVYAAKKERVCACVCVHSKSTGQNIFRKKKNL